MTMTMTKQTFKIGDRIRVTRGGSVYAPKGSTGVIDDPAETVFGARADDPARDRGGDYWAMLYHDPLDGFPACIGTAACFERMPSRVPLGLRWERFKNVLQRRLAAFLNPLG